MVACNMPTPRIGCCIAQGWRCASDAKPDRGLISHNAKRKQFPPKGGEVPAPVREISTDYWERLNDKLEWVLDGGPVYWSQPSDPQRLRLFVRTIDELRSQVAMEGLEPL